MVKHIVPLAILAAASLGAQAPAVAAVHEVPLAKVAAELGYGYAYLGPQDAVALSRPGVTVLIRPGERLFEVNDRTETTDKAPHFVRNDVYVSDTLVSRLRAIASRYPAAVSQQAPRALVVVTTTGQNVAQSDVHGAISLDIRQLPGSQSLAVSGKAPASAPITLTLLATFGEEIPDTVLSRNEVATDSDGRFQAVVPVAPGYFRGAILTLVATSLPGVTKATAQIVIKAPNGNVSVPAEQVPRSIR